MFLYLQTVILSRTISNPLNLIFTGSASASNTDKSNGETANATKKANSSVADVSKKLKTKKAKPEGKNVWQSVLVIAVIISVISISLPIFFPNLLGK